MPLTCLFFTIDIMEEAGGNLFLFQVLLYTKSTPFIMIYRMIRALVIRTGTEFSCIHFHFAISIKVSPVNR